MNQLRKKAVSNEGQFLYLGRWVDKAGFRAFVYAKNGDQKLANSYDDFLGLTTSGIWFDSLEKAAAASKVKEKRNDSTLSNSK